MPGLLSTTSQLVSAASPPAAVATTSRPSRLGDAGASSTSTGATPRERSRRMLARPSTPSPQTPTDASASADQEIGWRIAIRDQVGAARGKDGRRIDAAGGGRLGFAAEPLQQRRAGAVGPLRGQAQGGPALVDVAHALEWPGIGGESDQGAEARLVGGVLQGFLAGEHGDEVGAAHERAEDEVDEAALVARATPVVQPLGRVLTEGTVAAAEGTVEPGQPGELLGHPQLRPRPQVREDRETRAERSRDDLLEPALELVTLGPLVVDRPAV